MIRIAFVVEDLKWLGGVNYHRNLIGALLALPELKIDPFICVPDHLKVDAESVFPGIEVAGCPWLGTRGGCAFIRRVLRKLTGSDYIMESFLKKQGAALLSHAYPLGPGCRLPTLSWIADFQHMHLPQNFGAAGLKARRRELTFICRHAVGLLVSSEAALADLAKFDRMAVDKAEVLRFSVNPGAFATITSLADLKKTYGFDGPYFHLPNQFWAHKNHGLVVRALMELKKAGKSVLILVTGGSHDPRNPGHFDSIAQFIKAEGLEENFRILGIVPYANMIGLMQHSLAVINPSFFEGWSTSVEEGKAIGKTLIISDIPVHREQADGMATFFDPNNASELAEILWSVWLKGGGAKNKTHAQIIADARRRWLELAARYAAIVTRVLSRQ